MTYRVQITYTEPLEVYDIKDPDDDVIEVDGDVTRCRDVTALVLAASDGVQWAAAEVLDHVHSVSDVERAKYLGHIAGNGSLTVTRPNPAYLGPDVLFGDPPPETITETETL